MNQLVLSEKAASLLAQWHGSRGDNALPSAKFIDPIKLRGWVGDLSVVHLHEGKRRFYVALHGSNAARHLGPNFHQKYLEDVAPLTAHANTFAPYQLSIKTKQPTYSIQRASLDSGLFKTLERMILPCSLDDPSTVARFLIWVAPIESKSPHSSLAFSPYDQGEPHSNGSEIMENWADLFLLSDEYAVPPNSN